jgi:hypothetical protein
MRIHNTHFGGARAWEEREGGLDDFVQKLVPFAVRSFIFRLARRTKIVSKRSKRKGAVHGSL